MSPIGSNCVKLEIVNCPPSLSWAQPVNITLFQAQAEISSKSSLFFQAQADLSLSFYLLNTVSIFSVSVWAEASDLICLFTNFACQAFKPEWELGCLQMISWILDNSQVNLQYKYSTTAIQHG